MTEPPPGHEPSRDWRAWWRAAADPRIGGEIAALYGRLDREVARRGPRCDASGRCCHFESWGHRLYVTGLEIAWFLTRAPDPAPEAAVGTAASGGESGARSLPVLAAAPARDGCPWQVAGCCTAHAVRPMGCRVFFCEPGSEDWQQDLYERMLGELRHIHTLHDLTWRYMEWRSGLAEVGRGKP